MSKNQENKAFFGENLKRVRKARKVTQADLANKIGAKQNTISNYESGQSYPDDPNKMDILIDILDTSFEELHKPIRVSEGASVFSSLSSGSQLSVIDIIAALESRYPQEELIRLLKNQVLELQLDKSNAESKLISLYERLEKRLGFKFDD